MGKQYDHFEESTKIRSPEELDQMLREVKTRPPTEDVDDLPEFDDFDAHTQIGNVKDLVAQTAIPDPPPVVSRVASTNIIRRTTPLPFAAARPSSEMPVVRAQGSLSEIQAPAVDPEDLAFAAWDEPAPLAPVEVPIVEATAVVEPVAPTVVEIEAPAIVAPPIETVPAKTQWRWGAIAWVVLLVASIAMGVLGYRRITQLEDEIARLEKSR